MTTPLPDYIPRKIEAAVGHAGFDEVSRCAELQSRQLKTLYPVLMSLLDLNQDNEEVIPTGPIHHSLLDPELQTIMALFSVSVTAEFREKVPELEAVHLVALPLRGQRARVIQHPTHPVIFINEHELFLADALAQFAGSHAHLYGNAAAMRHQNEPFVWPPESAGIDELADKLSEYYVRLWVDAGLREFATRYRPFMDMQILFMAELVSAVRCDDNSGSQSVPSALVGTIRDKFLRPMEEGLPVVSPLVMQSFVTSYLIRIVAHELRHIIANHTLWRDPELLGEIDTEEDESEHRQVWNEIEADLMYLDYCKEMPAFRLAHVSPYMVLGAASQASVGFVFSMFSTYFYFDKPLIHFELFLAQIFYIKSFRHLTGASNSHPSSLERMELAYKIECLLLSAMPEVEGFLEASLSALALHHILVQDSWDHVQDGHSLLWKRPIHYCMNCMRRHPLLGEDELLRRIKWFGELDAQTQETLWRSYIQIYESGDPFGDQIVGVAQVSKSEMGIVRSFLNGLKDQHAR